ncbi:MAG: sulfatase-like hydrolase/transferase [Chitinophagales bacterium]
MTKLFTSLLILTSLIAQSQNVTIGPVSSFLCAGDSISVHFTVTGSFSNGNYFVIQASSPNGSFAKPVTLDSFKAHLTGDDTIVIPYTLTAGNGYRFRIKSTNPPVIGPDNGTNIQIYNKKPNISSNGPHTFNDGGSVTLKTDTMGVSYQWTKWGDEIPGAEQKKITVNRSGAYSITVTYSNGCENPSDTLNVTMIPSTTNANPPNILLFISDDASYATTDLTGAPYYFKSPNLDRIANEGANFSNGFVVYSYCIPSRATMLSGLYPHIHGAVNNSTKLNKIYQTIASILQDDGYYTAQVGKYHFAAQPQPGYDYWCASSTLQYENPKFVVNGEFKALTGHFTDIVTDTTIALINRMPEPFFLLTEHFAPHKPWIPLPQDAELWDDLKMTAPYNFAPWLNNFPSFHYKFNPEAPIFFEGTSFDSIQRIYYQCMQGIERSMGEVLAALEQKGILDSTIIIYISDNGYMNGSHVLNGKIAPYEESIRIPIFIRYPKWFNDSTLIKNQLALNLDIAPTLLDAAGITSDYGMQGLSLHKLATGQAKRNNFLYEVYGDAADAELSASLRSVRDFHYKFNHYFCSDTTEEFFNIQKDPFEKTNLINDPNYQTLIQQYRYKLDSLRTVFLDTAQLDFFLADCKLKNPASGPVMNVSLKVTNEACNNNKGKISTVITGGTPPFTYLWSNGANTASLSGLNEGTYTVTVTDHKLYKVVDKATILNVNSLYNIVTPEDTSVCSGANVKLHGGINRLKSFVKYVNKTIPDNKPAGLSSSIVASGLSLPAKLHSVTVNIMHPFDDDVELQLVCPDGSIIKLAERSGEGGRNFTKTVFTDTASVLIADTTAPFTGAYQPQNSLSMLNGCTMNGTWKLKVIDHAQFDVGILQNWSINFQQDASSTSFNWSPVTYLQNEITLSPKARPYTPITYNLISNDGTCIDTAQSKISIMACKTTDGISGMSEIGIYPNPASSFVNIVWSGDGIQSAEVTLCDIFGKEIRSEKYELLSGQAEILNVSDLVAGPYLLKIVYGGEAHRVKVIKI